MDRSRDRAWESETLKDEAAHIIEEARMVLPGIQALFGFQLIAVFNQRYVELPPIGSAVHLASNLGQHRNRVDHGTRSISSHGRAGQGISAVDSNHLSADMCGLDTADAGIGFRYLRRLLFHDIERNIERIDLVCIVRRVFVGLVFAASIDAPAFANIQGKINGLNANERSNHEERHRDQLA